MHTFAIAVMWKCLSRTYRHFKTKSITILYWHFTPWSWGGKQLLTQKHFRLVATCQRRCCVKYYVNRLIDYSTQYLVFPISTCIDITLYQRIKCFVFLKCNVRSSWIILSPVHTIENTRLLCFEDKLAEFSATLSFFIYTRFRYFLGRRKFQSKTI